MKTKLLSVIAGFLMLSHCSDSALAGTITVTTTNDSGAGSVRQAILDANASPAAPATSAREFSSETSNSAAGMPARILQ